MKTFNESELIAHLLRFKNEYGRIPKSKDFKINPDYPAPYHYKKVFKTFKNALLKSGLIHDVDHNYWSDMDSLEKFYYLGFLMGDGYIRDDKTVRVKLSINDIEWLDNFKQNLHIPRKIYIEDERPHRNSISCSLNITSEQWVSDLANYGVVNNKTGIEHFPLEYCNSDQEIAALCLGFHDSDGSIHDGGFSMCGSYDVVSHYQQVLNDILGVSRNSIFTNSAKTLHNIHYAAKSDLKKIGNFLYQNNVELNNCMLHRKRAKWMEFLD